MQQVDVDLKGAEAVERLLGSLGEVPNACIRVGSILLVKYQGAEGSVAFVRTLSQLEIRAFEQFPELQQNPQKVLGALSLAASQLDDNPRSSSISDA